MKRKGIGRRGRRYRGWIGLILPLFLYGCVDGTLTGSDLPGIGDGTVTTPTTSTPSNANADEIRRIQERIAEIKAQIAKNDKLIDGYDKSADRLEAMGASPVTVISQRNKAIALTNQNLTLISEWESLNKKLAALRG